MSPCYLPEVVATRRSSHSSSSQSDFLAESEQITFFWSPESKPHGQFFGKFLKKSRGLPPDNYGTIRMYVFTIEGSIFRYKEKNKTKIVKLIKKTNYEHQTNRYGE